MALARGLGLTETYNLFHESTEGSDDIQRLRDIHAEMDWAVAAAYGWSDLDLGHGFHETKQGRRFTISESARREVLARLLRLNHERYAGEEKQKADEVTPRLRAAEKSKPKKPRKKKEATTPAGMTLFGMDEVDTPFPSTGRDKLLCGLLCDLVSAQPGLPSSDYLDAMVIAMKPQGADQLLIDQDRAQFIHLATKVTTVGAPIPAVIPWHDLTRSLTLRGALRKNVDESLEVGDQFDEVRATYPKLESGLIQLIHKAAARLRELRDPDRAGSPESEGVLSEFDRERQALGGAIP